MTQTQPGDTFSRSNLREVAIRQKIILLCVLVRVICLVLRLLGPADFIPISWIITFATAVVATVFVFLLAIKLYRTAVGIVLGILTLIPLIGLIILLIVNGKATSVLKKNGISVGLMGASIGSIEDVQSHDGDGPPPLP